MYNRITFLWFFSSLIQIYLSSTDVTPGGCYFEIKKVCLRDCACVWCNDIDIEGCYNFAAFHVDKCNNITQTSEECVQHAKHNSIIIIGSSIIIMIVPTVLFITFVTLFIFCNSELFTKKKSVVINFIFGKNMHFDKTEEDYEMNEQEKEEKKEIYRDIDIYTDIKKSEGIKDTRN